MDHGKTQGVIESGASVKGTVYALCDITHVSLYPWRDDGYKCVAIDVYPHIGGDGVIHVCQDIHSGSMVSFINRRTMKRSKRKRVVK